MSSVEYIDAPIVTSPDTLAEAAYAYIQSQVPGWSPNAGNLEVILIESLARMTADARDVASAVPKSIFRYFGNSVMGIAPLAEINASGVSTWTALDNAGYTIPAGTQVGLRAAGDELIAFQVANDIVIPPGSTATAAGAVSLIALIAGEDANSLTGTAELIDALDWVSSIVVVGQTSGGVTAESDDSYLNRLAAELSLLTPRPILPDDFTVLARTVPGVARALALDGYDPGLGTFSHERMIAIAVIDEDGNAVSGPVKSSVDALLQAEREVNFVVNVIDPTYNLIDVTVLYKVLAGSDIAATDTAVEAAISEYLSPANWGRTDNGTDQTSWVDSSVVRYLELATVINNVPGVNYITSLTMAKNPAALTAADVAIAGVAQMTRPNNINATGS